MERITRRKIIDVIVREASAFGFLGDERDGEAPPITLENFSDVIFRLGARALRGRLSRLSLAELLGELDRAATYLESRQEQHKQIIAMAERLRLDDAAETLRRRQAELGRRPRLQSAILAAARHYRAKGKSSKVAWDAIKQRPYEAGNGVSVVVDDQETMHVHSSNALQKRTGIREAQWRQTYWPAAARVC
jgi:hypothetical protein